MSLTLISVIIPSYNHGKYIQQAVESVLSQSYKSLELIVVDDGSRDSSLDYLQTVSDPRFKLIVQENAGAHNAINRGLSTAEGGYLSILNSDDVFHPERLAECSERIQQGVDLVASWIELIDKRGKVLGVKRGWQNMLPWHIESPMHGMVIGDDFTLNLLMSNFVSTTSNIVFTRRVYEEAGGMRNLRFAHDWDFLLRVARTFHCEMIEKPLLQYRTHQSNTISSNRAWMLFEICWIYAVHLRYFTEKMFPRSGEADGFTNEIKFLARSINTQGNDKVLWMLLHYLNESELIGEVAPEETLLDDERLRSAFIRHIAS